MVGCDLYYVIGCAGNYNGPGEYNGDGWDGGRGFGGRGRGRARGRGFWGRGRGFGGQPGGYYDYGELGAPQGRGKFMVQWFVCPVIVNLFYYLRHLSKNS